MAFPFAYIPFGHLAAGGFDFQAAYAAASASRKILVTSNAGLQAAVQARNTEGAGTEPYYIALANNDYTLSLNGNSALLADRTISSQVYIGPLNKNEVNVGIDASGSVWNDGNRIDMSGSYWNICGLNFRFARRASNNQYLTKLDNGANNNRITGCRLTSCGSGLEGAIDVYVRTWSNLIDHCIFDNYNNRNAIIASNNPIKFQAWGGGVSITGVTRSGTIATYTFRQPDSNGHTIVDTDTVRVWGFIEPEYNVYDATIVPGSVVINGNSSTFQVDIGATPSSPGTLIQAIVSPQLNIPQAGGKNTQFRSTIDNVVEFNTFFNFREWSGNGDQVWAQNCDNKPKANESEDANCIWRNNWDFDNTAEEVCNDKGSASEFYNNVGLGTSTFMLRAGHRKKYYNNIRPNAGITITGGEHEIYHNVCRSITLRKWGALDGNVANGQYDEWFMQTDDSDLYRNTVLEGTTLLDLCRTEGFTVGGVTRTASEVPDGVAIEDHLLIKSSAGVAVSYNGETLTNFTFDGCHYDLTTATAGEDSSNKTTGALAGLWFRPLLGSPSAVLTGGVRVATTDAEGRTNFAGRGALAPHAPDFLFEDTFTGTADTAVTLHSADTNETGSLWTTPTASWLLDGSGAAKASAANQANFINTGSSNHRSEMMANAGGVANIIRSWIGANAQATEGVYAEFDLANSSARLFRVTGGVHTELLPVPVTGIPSLGASADNVIWAMKRGAAHQWAIRGMPILHCDITGITGTYCGFQHGAFINNAARVKSFDVETDATSGGGGGGPTTEVISYSHTFTGTNGTNFQDLAPDIGDGQSVFASTEAGNLKISNANSLRANTNNLNVYTVYELELDSELTQNSADGEISYDCVGSWTGASSSHHPAWLAGVRVADANNMYGFASMYDENAGESMVYIYRKLAGTVTTLDSAQVDFAEGNNFKYRFIGDTLSILLDDVEVASATDSNITAAGGVLFGQGAYFDATHDICFDNRIDNLTYTEFVADPEIDPTAPIFLTQPQIIGVGDAALSFEARCDIEAKHYLKVWNTINDMTLDATGVAHVIAGEDPDGSSVGEEDSITDTDAGEVVNLSATGLSASPKWKWAYTATAEADDTEMTQPVTGEQLLAAPTDFTYTEISNASLVNQSGIIYQMFGAMTDGSVIKTDELSTNGNPVIVDAFGNVSVDTGGEADSYDVDLWDYNARTWAGTETINIAGTTPQVVSGIIKNASGSAVVSTEVAYMWLVAGKSYQWNWNGAQTAMTDTNGRITIDVPEVGTGDLMMRLTSDLTKVYFEPDSTAA